MNWIKIEELKLMMKFSGSTLKELKESVEYVGRTWVGESPAILYKFK